MTKRCDADLFEVLIGKIRQNDKGDVVLGKAVSVLPETKLLEPFHNLLHRGPLRIQRYPFWTGGNKSLAHAPAYCNF